MPRNQEIGDDHPAHEMNQSPASKRRATSGAAPGVTSEDADYHIDRQGTQHRFDKSAKNRGNLEHQESEITPEKPNFDEASDSGESSSSGQGSTLTRGGVK